MRLPNVGVNANGKAAKRGKLRHQKVSSPPVQVLRLQNNKTTHRSLSCFGARERT
ncbi:MAG: hypothetical protein KIH63_000660 [Candidatus Saccharibacteria bacterium]|nr:hypothetical protein [Candidatus Saccharibacteria bacterium]